MSISFYEIKKHEHEIIDIRRQIHANPELSYQEFETPRLIAEKLESLGTEVTKGVGGTGVLGLLKGSFDGNCMGLRADMDALPVNEDVDVPFTSKKTWVRHAAVTTRMLPCCWERQCYL